MFIQKIINNMKNNQTKFQTKLKPFSTIKTKPTTVGTLFKITKTKKIKNQKLGKWDKSESQKFVNALALYGTSWSKIATHIGTRSRIQVISKYQKFIKKHRRRYFNFSKINGVESIQKYISEKFIQDKYITNCLEKERLCKLVYNEISKVYSLSNQFSTEVSLSRVSYLVIESEDSYRDNAFMIDINMEGLSERNESGLLYDGLSIVDWADFLN
jgi:hypothetical protein